MSSAPPPEGPRLASAPPTDPDAATGLPGLRSWRRVYLAVGGIFVLWVGLLTWLTAAYS